MSPQFDFNTLVDYLTSPSWEQRRDAAEDLGAYGAPQAIPYLEKTLTDAVGAVQYASVVALGQIGTKDAVNPLLACLGRSDFRFPAAVLEALGNLRMKETVNHLIFYLRSSDPHVRAIANTSLMVTTGQTMRFSANADDATREAAVQKWELWWRQNAATFQVPGKGPRKAARRAAPKAPKAPKGAAKRAPPRRR